MRSWAVPVGLEATNRDVSVADVHAGPSRPRMREPGGDRGHRAPGQVSLVAARSRPGLSRGGAEPTRISDESESAGRLPRWELWRALPDPPDAPVYARVALEAPGTVAGRTLQGSGKAAREASGAGGKVSDPQEVPTTPHYLGRRAKNALFQGNDNIWPNLKPRLLKAHMTTIKHVYLTLKRAF